MSKQIRIRKSLRGAPSGRGDVVILIIYEIASPPWADRADRNDKNG